MRMDDRSGLSGSGFVLHVLPLMETRHQIQHEIPHEEVYQQGSVITLCWICEWGVSNRTCLQHTRNINRLSSHTNLTL